MQIRVVNPNEREKCSLKNLLILSLIAVILIIFFFVLLVILSFTVPITKEITSPATTTITFFQTSGKTTPTTPFPIITQPSNKRTTTTPVKITETTSGANQSTTAITTTAPVSTTELASVIEVTEITQTTTTAGSTQRATATTITASMSTAESATFTETTRTRESTTEAATTVEPIPTFPSVTKISELGKTQNTHYFPILTNGNVSFAGAPNLCESLTSYSLASSKSANRKILNETASLIAYATSDFVWVGGMFNLSSDHPYLIYWTDGSVTDFKKAPPGLFCDDVGTRLESLRLRPTKAPRTTLPLVRSRNNARCIDVLEDEVQAPGNKKLQALCLMSKPRLSRKLDDGSTQLTKLIERYPHIYNAESNTYSSPLSGAWNDVPETDTFAIKIFAGRTSLRHILGLKDQVPYEYAKEYCRPLKSAFDGDIEGHFLTGSVLNSSEVDSEHYQRHFNDKASMIELHMEGYLNSKPRIAATTAGYFDFRSNNFNSLNWLNHNGTIQTTDQLKMGFKFCEGRDPIENLEKIYANFSVWNDADGRLTTGPKRVYLGVEIHGVLMGNGTCLRLVDEELYWPGSYPYAKASLLFLTNSFQHQLKPPPSLANYSCNG